MRVSVIIPTTDGPAQVLRLAPLQNAPRSVMRTQDDYRPLPVSTAYQAFAAAGGPMDIAFGLDAAAFDLRLSARIDTGRSWELPVALAHWLQAHCHQVETQAPELVVWASGALDLDMNVIAQDYHLSAKLSGSRNLLQACVKDQTPVLVLSPAAVALPRGLPDNVLFHQIESFAEAIAKLSPLVGARNGSSSESVTTTQRWSPWIGFGALGCIGAFALAVALIPSQPTSLAPDLGAADGEQKPGFKLNYTGEAAEEREEEFAQYEDDSGAEATTVLETEVAIQPQLLLLRSEEDTSCIDLHFGDTAPQSESQTAAKNTFEDAALDGLCSIGLKLPAQASAHLNVQVPEALLAYITRSERVKEFTLSPGEERIFRLTVNLPSRLDLRWQVSDASGDRSEFHHSLMAQR